MGDMSKEPSMEEILSSIKRIIAEDGEEQGREGGKRAAGKRDAERDSHRKAVVANLVRDVREGAGSSYVDEVLELTEEMPRAGRAGEAPPQSGKIDMAEVNDMADELELTDSMTETTEMPARKMSVHPAPGDTIVSVESEVAARTSLAALSSMIVKAQEPGDNTLEGLVREMLRPMLKDWLDANLPTVVEAMVAKEIARITGRAL